MGQLVQATTQFEISKKRYPGLMETFGEVKTTNLVKVGTWAVALLPFIENEPLYDAWQDPTSTSSWTTTSANFYPTIKIFQCSSDSLSTETQAVNSFVCNAGFAPVGTNVGSIVGYGGTASADSTRSQRPQNCVFNNRLPANVASPLTGGTATAVFGAGAQPSKADTVKDGLTQTIAFSENLQADQWGYVNIANDSARYAHGMVWLYRLDDPTQKSAGRPDPDSVQTTNRINGNKLQATTGMEAARPSSGHFGVVNVGMLGGSVSAMSDQIDYHVYQALLTPHTKQAMSPM